jgi:rubrerythrin
MQRPFRFLLTCAMVLGTSMGTVAYSQQMSSKSDSKGGDDLTIENLRSAYEAELSSRDRYLIYAQKADDEGYGQVGSMFRAVARGEEIHANNLASMLPQGGTESSSKSDIEALSTEDNLRTALAEQRFERDVLYPQFLKKVKKEKNKDLEKTLDRNMAAEPLHFAWYAQALSDLDGYKGGNIDFYVCPGCGNTVRAVTFDKCPVCGMAGDKFELVR